MHINKIFHLFTIFLIILLLYFIGIKDNLSFPNFFFFQLFAPQVLDSAAAGNLWYDWKERKHYLFNDFHMNEWNSNIIFDYVRLLGSVLLFHNIIFPCHSMKHFKKPVVFETLLREVVSHSVILLSENSMFINKLNCAVYKINFSRE